MPKARKSDTVSKGAADVPTVNVEVVSDKKGSKSTKAAAAAKPAKVTKATKPEVTLTKNEPVVQEVVEATKEDLVLTDTFSSFLGKLQALASQMNALKTEFRYLRRKLLVNLKLPRK